MAKRGVKLGSIRGNYSKTSRKSSFYKTRVQAKVLFRARKNGGLGEYTHVKSLLKKQGIAKSEILFLEGSGYRIWNETYGMYEYFGMKGGYGLYE